MSVYNVEIFSNDFAFRCAVQVQSIEYEFDYLDIGKNKVKHMDIKAQKGDYIRITGKKKIVGIVSDVKKDKGSIEVEYKSFMSLFDLKIYTEISSMSTVESWIALQIEKIFVSNSDTAHNVTGLQVSVLTSTPGTLDYADDINNLYDIIISAFNVYNIVVSFDIVIGKKKIEVSIGQAKNARFTIESYLPNIKEFEVTFKEDDGIKNKVKIYNSENRSEYAVYYLDQDDNVTMNPKTRRLPVNYVEVEVKVSSKKTFAEAAEIKAMSTLKTSKLDNLIEITCALEDPIVKPFTRNIGQIVNIITKDGTVYTSALTGYEFDETEAKLIFGAIRLELTKQLKKWRRTL